MIKKAVTSLNFFQDILAQEEYIYRSLLLMVLLAASYLFIRENGKEAKRKLLSLFRQPWHALFFFHTALILTATLFARTRIVPYKSIWKDLNLLTNGRLNGESIRNMLMFVPYTFFFLQAFKPGKPWRTALILSVATTLFIEFSQLLFWLGEFQLSDILHNVLGGLIGCGLFCLVNWIVRRRR